MNTIARPEFEVLASELTSGPCTLMHFPHGCDKILLSPRANRAEITRHRRSPPGLEESRELDQNLAHLEFMGES